MMTSPPTPEFETATAAPARPRSPAFALRRWIIWLAVPVLLGIALLTLWNSEWLKAPRAMWELARMPAPSALPVPVEGVAARRIADTFGAPRGRDRTHAGVDIFAKRGTPVRSAAPGVVVAVRDRDNLYNGSTPLGPLARPKLSRPPKFTKLKERCRRGHPKPLKHCVEATPNPREAASRPLT